MYVGEAGREVRGAGGAEGAESAQGAGGAFVLAESVDAAAAAFAAFLGPPSSGAASRARGPVRLLSAPAAGLHLGAAGFAGLVRAGWEAAWEQARGRGEGEGEGGAGPVCLPEGSLALLDCAAAPGRAAEALAFFPPPAPALGPDAGGAAAAAAALSPAPPLAGLGWGVVCGPPDEVRAHPALAAAAQARGLVFLGRTPPLLGKSPARPYHGGEGDERA